jgi:hypothetical protein
LISNSTVGAVVSSSPVFGFVCAAAETGGENGVKTAETPVVLTGANRLGEAIREATLNL